MPFTSETANLKHNSGMSREDVERGYERLDPTADSNCYRWSTRCPENQGWRGRPEVDDEFGVAVYEQE